MSTIALNYRTINHTIKSLSIPSVNWKALLIMGIIVAIAMLVLYVVLVDGLAKGAYLIKNYDKRIQSLSQENQVLQVNMAHADYLNRITERAQALNFEKTSGITYIQLFENSVASAAQ